MCIFRGKTIDSWVSLGFDDKIIESEIPFTIHVDEFYPRIMKGSKIVAIHKSIALYAKLIESLVDRGKINKFRPLLVLPLKHNAGAKDLNWHCSTSGNLRLIERRMDSHEPPSLYVLSDDCDLDADPIMSRRQNVLIDLPRTLKSCCIVNYRCCQCAECNEYYGSIFFEYVTS